MKTRNGFVSNSSSSSFCIYGAKVNKDIVFDEDDVAKVGLEVIHGNSDYSDDCVYVGRSWKNIKDDETGAQFKINIENSLKEMFKIEKCITMEDAWYNG